MPFKKMMVIAALSAAALKYADFCLLSHVEGGFCSALLAFSSQRRAEANSLSLQTWDDDTK